MADIQHKLITEIYNLSVKFRLARMGIRKCVVKKEDGIIYYEGGSNFKETIILIHGFADSKNGHLMVANKLLFKYRVLIPDLPGFGENTKNYQAQYSISFMAEKIIELLHEKKLEKVHILGNSLGGAVAMEIASKAPSLVKSLILVGSAGFYKSTIRTVQNDLLEGNYIFEVKSNNEFKTLVERVYAKPPKLPSFLFNYLSKDFQSQGKWYRKLLDDLLDGSSAKDTSDKLVKDSYNNKANAFPMNTLLLWGEKDNIFPTSIAQFAKTIIPNSTLTILKNAGHAPQHENLLDYIEALLEFLKENESNNPLVSKL